MEQARITAWSPNNWESLFQISKGSLSGIEAGDAVITEYGAFVGQVTEVGTSSATRAHGHRRQPPPSASSSGRTAPPPCSPATTRSWARAS